VNVEFFEEVLAAPGVCQRRLTLWSEVFEPSRRTVHVAPGRPDRNAFVSFELQRGVAYKEDLAVRV